MAIGDKTGEKLGGRKDTVDYTDISQFLSGGYLTQHEAVCFEPVFRSLRRMQMLAEQYAGQQPPPGLRWLADSKSLIDQVLERFGPVADMFAAWHDSQLVTAQDTLVNKYFAASAKTGQQMAQEAGGGIFAPAQAPSIVLEMSQLPAGIRDYFERETAKAGGGDIWLHAGHDQTRQAQTQQAQPRIVERPASGGDRLSPSPKT